MSGEQKIRKEGDLPTPENPMFKEGMNFFFYKSVPGIRSLMILLIAKASVVKMFRKSLKWQRVNRWFTLLLCRNIRDKTNFVFDNGKLGKVDMASYATKTNRRSLLTLIQINRPRRQYTLKKILNWLFALQAETITLDAIYK